MPTTDAKDGKKEDIPLATIRIFGMDREGSEYLIEPGLSLTGYGTQSI